MAKKVIIMVCSDCNANCRHCYLPYKGNMKLEDATRLVRNFQKQGYGITVAGSELLLNLDYLKPYQLANQEHMLTNGILISQKPEIIDELKKHGIEEIRVSMHFGLEKELRSVPEHVVVKAVNNSLAKGFPVKLFTTINRNNYKYVVGMCHRTYGMGAFGIKFIRQVSSGKAKNEADLTLDKEQRLEFFKKIDEARKVYPKEKLEILVHGNFGPKPGSKGEKLSESNSYCPAGVDMFTIDPEGNVYGCPLLMEFPIGKLIDGKIAVEKELCDGKRDICITDYLL